MAHVSHYLGELDYESGGGRKARKLTFTVDVITPDPVELSHHDCYAWTSLIEEPPVSTRVRKILSWYRTEI